MIEKKVIFDVDTKNLDEEGVFYGYASVFDVVDEQGDIISSGAFDLTKCVPLLWQHRQDQPIGKVLEMQETEKGLYLKGHIIMEVNQGYEAYKLLKAGVLNGLSIGYIPKKYKMDKHTGARIMTAVKLIEVSLVTFPANKYARISSVKSQYDADQLLEARLVRLIEIVRKEFA
ncbi:HK97 family phage prohead protease [Neorickettsia risticii]